MKRERNKKGKLLGAFYTQVIVEKPFKNGKPNPLYPNRTVIRHYVLPK